jgi:23S rRNA (cytosine1962-C5)-methyltransferase
VSEHPSVRVSRKGADRILSGHPWVFASDILDRGSATAGAAVRVVDARGKLLGTAHYSSTSQITLRMLSRQAESIDEAFLRRAVERAISFRQKKVQQSSAYRLVYGEADGLPGLVVDRYDQYLVLQLLTQGMDHAKDLIVQVLNEILQPKGMLARNDVAVRAKENLPQEIAILHGEIPPTVDIEMNGLHLRTDLQVGQKTGVFLDQRENYLAARRWAHGRALDCFTGSGGFALHLAGACESVEAVDSSASAIASAKANAQLNGLDNVEFRETNVLDYLPSLVSARRRFDTVVVDPPAFTKSRSALEGAARGYKEVNLRALKLLDAGGVLVSCSCSHHMSEAHLLELVAQAALDVGKTLRVLERRTQAVDHPILLTVPETHYLKCLVFEVV